MKRVLWGVIGGAAMMAASAALAVPADPLKSDMFQDMKAEYLGAGDVDFDFTFRIVARDGTEDPSSVSLLAKIPTGYGAIDEIVVLIENNPIPVAARVRPGGPVNAIGMNVRMEMSSPIRVAARTTDGVWRVASRHVEVVGGGGCTAPVAYQDVALGEVKVKLFDRQVGGSRLKVKINHPMHTGLAPDDSGELIPEYFINRIDIADDHGGIVEMETWAAMASDPVITLDLPDRRQNVRVRASDSSGLEFEGGEGAPSM